MPYYWTQLNSAGKKAYIWSRTNFGTKAITSNRLFYSEWLQSYAISNLNAHFAFRDKFLNNAGSNRVAVTPFSNAAIIAEFKKLSEAQKNEIYTNTKYMNDNSHSAARRTAFVTWAKDTNVRTSPLLLHHYLNTDSLSKTHYEAWTPFWHFSKSDYENIAKLSKAAMEPTVDSGKTKKTQVAKTENIALIEYFTKILAQKADKGIPMDNLDLGANRDGRKFWSWMWRFSDWAKQFDWQNSSPLWHKYYANFDIKTSDISTGDQETLINKRLNAEEWVQSPFMFEQFKWVIEIMKNKGDVQVKGDYFEDPDDKVVISEEILDLDKTDATSPIEAYEDYKTNQKNHIWANAFVQKDANYKADLAAWQTSTFKTSSDADDTFDKWSKNIQNGKAEYTKYYDANAGEYSSWTLFTKKTQSEYDVIVPTWANTKTLWAKKTYKSWTGPSSFKSWYDSKTEAYLLGEYKKTSLKDARAKLDTE